MNKNINNAYIYIYIPFHFILSYFSFLVLINYLFFKQRKAINVTKQQQQQLVIAFQQLHLSVTHLINFD